MIIQPPILRPDAVPVPPEPLAVHPTPPTPPSPRVAENRSSTEAPRRERRRRREPVSEERRKALAGEAAASHPETAPGPAEPPVEAEKSETLGTHIDVRV